MNISKKPLKIKNKNTQSILNINAIIKMTKIIEDISMKTNMIQGKVMIGNPMVTFQDKDRFKEIKKMMILMKKRKENGEKMLPQLKKESVVGNMRMILEDSIKQGINEMKSLLTDLRKANSIRDRIKDGRNNWYPKFVKKLLTGI